MIILKYHEWLRLFPDIKDTVYELCGDDYRKIRQISKEEAIQMIADNGLTRVHRNRYGAIWK